TSSFPVPIPSICRDSARRKAPGLPLLPRRPACPMRLFIAEKPSLARAIAEALPLPHKRAAQHIECGEGNVVAWCAGHILQTAPPEAYGPNYKSWRLEHLPIVPNDWKL